MSRSPEDAGSFESRLARTLRGVERPKPAPVPRPASLTAPQSAPLPEWYLRRAARTPAAGSRPAPGSPRPHAARTQGAPERLAESSNRRGSFGERVARFAPEHCHGAHALASVLGARGDLLATLTGDAALAGFDAREATFLDIETTGLSGGAGTQVFLIGLLTVAGDGFELWQGFLRSPAEAPALLEASAERVRARGALVSFFGKSFDRHRLEDQMRLHGVAPPFAGRAHLDLYHPCRRLYGEAFADGRLATMERELCGVRREDDLPGAFAPAAWFDFLAGREHSLEAVFRHNELDVLSLASLCAHVAGVLAPEADGSRSEEFAARRARALARLFATRRDWPRTLAWSERALALSPEDRAALAYRARALQRLGRAEESLADFERTARLGADALAAESWVEVAWIAARLGRGEAAQAALAQAERLIPITLTGTRAARALERAARAKAHSARERQHPGPAEPGVG